MAGARNRLATVFFYLNNVTAGGQTNFPRAQTTEQPNGQAQIRDYFDCTKGLSVYPLEGRVIIFYSMLPSGGMDDYSLHGGCAPPTPTPNPNPLPTVPHRVAIGRRRHRVRFPPQSSFLHATPRRPFLIWAGDVLKAEETKWSANFWLWNKPNHFGHSPARKRFTKELEMQSL